MSDFLTGAAALWLPTTIGGLMFIAANVVVRVRDWVTARRANPYLAAYDRAHDDSTLRGIEVPLRRFMWDEAQRQVDEEVWR